MQEERLQSERMGTMPEGKLLLSMAVPMMLSMLMQALYNIVDSVYVSHVSEDCLTALSLAFPAQNILIGLATGTGVGVSALVSRALGRDDRKNANRVAGNAIMLCFVMWALMAAFGLFFARSFIHSQTTDPVIRAYGDSYLRIVTIGSLFVYFEITFQRLLQSTGCTKEAMWAQITGAVANIVLDPFLIYGWCGLPAMGTAGAAIATVIGQALGATVGFTFNRRRNTDLHVTWANLRPDKHIIGEIYKIGLPSILMMCVSSVTNYIMNNILIAFSATAVAVLGAYFKLNSFFFMPVFGLNNAFVPVVGYNFGAGKEKRVRRSYQYAVLYALVLMSFGSVVFELCPKLLLGFFSASDAMLAIGVPALRIIGTFFPIAAFGIVTCSLCQALGRSGLSLIVSIMRQFAALVPSALLLARTGNVNNVWWCFLIAEFISAICCIFFYRITMRDMSRQICKNGGAAHNA